MAFHNTEIEQTLLGNILLDNAEYDKIADFFHADYFFEPVHGRIYTAIGDVINRGQPAMAARLREYFEDDPVLEKIGKGDYLLGLLDVPPAIDIRGLAVYLFELWQHRRLTFLGMKIGEEWAEPDPEVTPADIVRGVEEELYDITSGGPEVSMRRAIDVSVAATEQIVAAYKSSRRGEIVGLPTGIDGLDRKLGGLVAPNLYVVAGATSMGKSGLATTIADNVARAGKSVLFVSLEMSGEQISKRSISALTGFPVSQLEHGTLTDAEMSQVLKAGEIAAAWPITFEDRASMTIVELRSAARRQKLSGALDLIVVDYLQLMSSTEGKYYEGRTAEISKITRGLKTIAKELHVPVVALSQLSREVDRRDDKRPQLPDLRESGSIEQDADVVLFVYREAYYIERNPPKDNASDEDRANYETRKAAAEGKCELIIAKYRQGATGRITVAFDPVTTRFGNISTVDRNHELEGILDHG